MRPFFRAAVLPTFGPIERWPDSYTATRFKAYGAGPVEVVARRPLYIRVRSRLESTTGWGTTTRGMQWPPWGALLTPECTVREPTNS